jgi:hypothetical protein
MSKLILTKTNMSKGISEHNFLYYFFVYIKQGRAIIIIFPFFSSMVFGVYETWDSHRPPSHLDFCVKVKCVRLGSPFECVPLPKVINKCSWCNPYGFRHRMSLVLLVLNLKGLATKNTRRCILACSCFYCQESFFSLLLYCVFYDNPFLYSKVSPGSALVIVISLTLGTSSCS